MANDMLIKTSFLLSIVLLTLSSGEQILCSENNVLLETTGDAILTGKLLIYQYFNQLDLNLKISLRITCKEISLHCMLI